MNYCGLPNLALARKSYSIIKNIDMIFSFKLRLPGRLYDRKGILRRWVTVLAKRRPDLGTSLGS